VLVDCVWFCSVGVVALAVDAAQLALCSGVWDGAVACGASGDGVAVLVGLEKVAVVLHALPDR
jgi:hypothetical protein